MANYYNEKVLGKFKEALKEAVKGAKSGEIGKVKISNGNNKMGAVASVSTLPFITCPGSCKETCGNDCYAAKIANIRPSVLKSYANNTALAMYNPAEYWKQIKATMKGYRFFRFHVSGDILNREYFDNMIESCVENPHCEVLAFTKRFKIVNAWIKENGDLPKNLHILFSGWENMKPVNPHKLPETTVYNKGEDPREEWLLCGGNCFECGCRGVGCWQVKAGQTIAFQKH